MIVPARWDVPEPIAVFQVHAADGTSIAVRRHGNPDGPRLILSHGNGFSIVCVPVWWISLPERRSAVPPKGRATNFAARASTKLRSTNMSFVGR